MMQNRGNRMEAQIEKIHEMFNKEVEGLKNNQTKKNNTITEMVKAKLNRQKSHK